MVAFRAGTVVEILAERDGLQRVLVRADGDTAGAGERAYVLTRQIGTVSVGDEVVCNTTAVDLGLGTGGWHVVHWNLSRRSLSLPGPGHIMKMRYTSLQSDTGAAEEHHEVPDDLEGVPVVACTLHSQVPIVAAAVRLHRPGTRIAYVMTDGAALPLALSDLVAAMVATDLVDVTVTTGHAFGGDLEAVSIPSALSLACHAAGADVIVVAMGPGVVGTGRRLGTTAVEAASVLDAASALGGTPILCTRASGADTRPRHRGVSHHVRTVLDLTRSTVTVATVPDAPIEHDRHRVAVVDPVGVADLLVARGMRVTSMGRGAEDDPLFFDAAGAAGTVAAGHRRRGAGG